MYDWSFSENNELMFIIWILIEWKVIVISLIKIDWKQDWIDLIYKMLVIKFNIVIK